MLRRLFHGIDIQGRVCGIDSGVTDAPYAAWIDVVKHQDVFTCVQVLLSSWDFYLYVVLVLVSVCF